MYTVKNFCPFFQVSESTNHMSKQSNNGDCGSTLDGFTKKISFQESEFCWEF